MVKILFWILLLVSMVTGFNSCSTKKQKNNVMTEKPVGVLLSKASQGFQPAISASGNIEAVQIAGVSTRVMGRITQLFVKVGDKVQNGQLLATVFDDDIRAKRAQADAMIAEAEANYSSAKKDYDRFRNLFEQQSASAKELDNITLQYHSAEARVSSARQMQSEVNANLSYSRLTAPFTGVVTQKLAEVGNIANPGMPILTIERNDVLQVSSSVAESDIAAIHLGDSAFMQVKSTGKNIVGKIIQLNPSSQFTGGQYIVKISIPESARRDIYAGMFVTVSIPLKVNQPTENNVVLVPLSSIIHHDELTGIYTVSSGNTAMLRWIRLGKTFGEKVEVISGLSKNEKFIRSSDGALYNGAPVTVKEMPEATMITRNK